MKNDNENLSTLKTIIARSKNNYLNILKSKHEDLIQWIKEKTPLLKDDVHTIKTRIYWILNNLQEFPKCAVCGKEMNDKNVGSVNLGYAETCSIKCAANRKERVEKIRKTCLRKYGVVNYALSEDYRRKSKETCLRKYGVEYSFQSENNKRKSKETCLRKYGVECSMQSEDIRLKAKKTNIERYGAENVFASEEIKKKCEKTMLEKYGVKHCMCDDGMKRKAMKKLSVSKLRNSWERNILGDEYSTPDFTFDYYLKNYSRDFKFRFKCKKCGRVFSSVHCDGCHSRCQKCYPNTSSQGELEIFQFVSQIYGGKILRNDRTLINPLELDILIPDKRIALEFDGLYWHSLEVMKTKNRNIGKDYHLQKTLKCQEMGYRLIHIFEDEWRFHRKAVEHIIRNALGCLENKFPIALVQEFSWTEGLSFLETKTCLKPQNSSIIVGKKDSEGNISLLMMFKKGLKTEKDYMLVDFSSVFSEESSVESYIECLKYVMDVYGAEKITHCIDLRDNGKLNLMKCLGFETVKNIGPQPYYLDPQCLRRYGAQDLKKDVKYRRIYDCGHCFMSIP